MNPENKEIAPETAEKKPQSTFWKDLKEVVGFALIVLVILVPLRLFVAQPFVVVGDSMDPTFATGEYLIVDELSYHLHAPGRGDVIVFKYPLDTTKYFIKRIIGLPGETLVFKGKTITIKNSANPNGFVLNESYLSYTNNTDETITLDDSHYFVMGDNRPVSLDSRSWGPLPKNLIIGRAFARLLPISTFGILPGEHNQ
jgi:signal peptidase I